MKNVFSLAVFLLVFTGCSKQDPSHPVPSFQEFVTFDREKSADTHPTADCDETCQSRRQEFRYVVYVGKQIYCYWDLKKAETNTDFDTLASSLENSITTKTSATGFFLVLREWASAFHDGHVNVMTKSDVSSLETYSAPIRVEVLAPATDHEKLIIATIGAGVSGLAVGDEITAINNVRTKDALTLAALTSSSGSTERMRRFWAGRRIVDVMGVENGTQPFSVTVKSLLDGTSKSVSLFRTAQISAKPVPGTPAGPANTGANSIIAQVLPNAIGYLRLDGFGGSQDDFLISSAMESLSQTRGLLIDLRKNGGGDLSGDRVIERLTDQPIIRYKRSERLSDYALSRDPTLFGLTPDATGLFAQWHDLMVKPYISHHYDKPVVVLTSPWCFSACDTFSAALKDNHLATFVGESTGGGTGTPLVFDLPESPLSFRYSIIRGQTPAGDFIEGTGTAPDYLIEPTAADRALGTDTQLVSAITILEGKISNGQPIAPNTLASLSRLPSIWEQDLDRSPTEESNDLLLNIRFNDER